VGCFGAADLAGVVVAREDAFAGAAFAVPLLAGVDLARRLLASSATVGSCVGSAVASPHRDEFGAAWRGAEFVERHLLAAGFPDPGVRDDLAELAATLRRAA
jgi:hypothetical protein